MKFEIYSKRNRKGRRRFHVRLKSGNNKQIAHTQPNGYAKPETAEQAVRLMQLSWEAKIIRRPRAR